MMATSQIISLTVGINDVNDVNFNTLNVNRPTTSQHGGQRVQILPIPLRPFDRRKKQLGYVQWTQWLCS